MQLACPKLAFCPDLAPTLPQPCPNLARALPARTLPEPCFLPGPCPNLARTLPQSCPRPCPKLAPSLPQPCVGEVSNCQIIYAVKELKGGSKYSDHWVLNIQTIGFYCYYLPINYNDTNGNVFRANHHS